MGTIPKFARPPFGTALAAWQAALAERQLPQELIWVFDENLCFEKNPAAPGGFRLGFQTRFTPPPPEAAQIAYDCFCEFELPVVFYRIGSTRGKSVCLLLCDEWFEARNEKNGFLRRDEWFILLRPGPAGEIEEITDEARWKARLLRDRPLHDLDFCMTLRAVHETLAHGRVLSAYEHYALKFLDAWRRLLARPE